MDDVPASTLASIDELPGQIYTADQQCQLEQDDPTAYSCTGSVSHVINNQNMY